jgi:chemotaxis protein MotB
MSDPVKEIPPPKRRRRVKKAKGHGGHHGGAWKVAYADFVTAMMALFLVLWLVSQADQKLKEAIANYFRAPGVFDTLQGGILSQAKKVSQEPDSLISKDNEQMLFNTAQKLQQQFEKRPEFAKYKDQVKIEITDEGLKIQLVDEADRVSFPSGSSQLTPDAVAILQAIAADLCVLPNKINIGGHTDRRVLAAANGYTNWELSTDRANSARRLLESACIQPSQVNKIIGYADTVPLVPEDPYAAANRRISITVLRLSVEPPSASTAPGEEPPTGDALQLRPSQGASKPTASAQRRITPDELINDPEVRSKLLNEGAVTVGEPDVVPDVRKIKTDQEEKQR